MKRTLPTWIALAACVTLACGALAWLSVTTMRLERAEVRARAEALVEERVRLALWRMDGRLARLLAQESTRSVSAWESFYVPAHAFDQAGKAREPSTTRIASALLYGTTEDVRLHFAFNGSGPLRSPQVPAPEQRPLASSAGTTREQLTRYGALLSELEARMDRKALLELDPGTPSPEVVVAVRQVPQPVAQRADPAPELTQQQNVVEYSRRQMQAFGNAAYLNVPQEAAPTQEKVTVLTADAHEVQVSPMAPVWMGDELLLVRRVVRESGEVEIQGAWLDWPRVRSLLLEEVKDLLPGASLERVVPGTGDLLERRLASLPVRLVPGTVQVEVGGSTPVAWSLAAAWGAVVLALVAVGLLLFGAVSLSERRAAFVSAVTHELRTPLTTFRMYAEMLAEGMVTDEAQRRGYYETLQRESNRLAHLVENVLAYARLERKRAPKAAESVELGAFLQDNLRRSEERTGEAGMSLVLELDEALEAARVYVEPSAAEQVLFNLVDNACKYARGAEDTRVHVYAERRGSRIAVLVSDHGPGVSRVDAKNLFEPFSKSSERAAESAPGVGLGLALSRRLARAMGAELRYEGAPGQGATFALLLRAG
ncbi:sensor histidine kinase [Hyalangium rubrum]|uniref:histidine kinase n=1 Tax=Hyalangium rubrum TaxID=3103134 RepID=A0ABU5H899_9BACT|nr:HAMP domain-containing sensor histidine kinase [Hyalangium sp. s54d21]MDY7229699.1 HAMP domain-containing sensor histidine kinase [Hyalangium sp. s54d21]